MSGGWTGVWCQEEDEREGGEKESGEVITLKYAEDLGCKSLCRYRPELVRKAL